MLDRKERTGHFGSSVDAFEIEAVLPDRTSGLAAYREVVRSADISAGVYTLAAGSRDPQQPHTEDEVYVVMQGRASFRAGGRTQPAVPGSVIYVERGLEHRFVDIVEDLAVLVLFAPPEGSLQQRKDP